MMGPGAGGAGREGSVVAAAAGWAVGGARGAGRLGIRDPFPCGDGPALGEVTLRGMGGGARGFSKLSSPFLGNRGLCGGLSKGWTVP